MTVFALFVYAILAAGVGAAMSLYAEANPDASRWAGRVAVLFWPGLLLFLLTLILLRAALKADKDARKEALTEKEAA